MGGAWWKVLLSRAARDGAANSCSYRCNVDMLKLIQLGLTFANSEGDLPQCNGEMCVWQFNFRQGLARTQSLLLCTMHPAARSSVGLASFLTAPPPPSGLV